MIFRPGVRIMAPTTMFSVASHCAPSVPVTFQIDPLASTFRRKASAVVGKATCSEKVWISLSDVMATPIPAPNRSEAKGE
jgi:hypothetical protein